jgi:hypothetical protein
LSPFNKDLELLDVEICKAKPRIKREVSGVAGEMLIQNGMIYELRQGIMVCDE